MTAYGRCPTCGIPRMADRDPPSGSCMDCRLQSALEETRSQLRDLMREVFASVGRECDQSELDLSWREALRIVRRWNGVELLVRALRAELDAAVAQRDELRRHYDAAAPEHNLLDLLDMYMAYNLELTDCGQEGVCKLSPGCIRHWEERNRELVRENEALRSTQSRDMGEG